MAHHVLVKRVLEEDDLVVEFFELLDGWELS